MGKAVKRRCWQDSHTLEECWEDRGDEGTGEGVAEEGNEAASALKLELSFESGRLDKVRSLRRGKRALPSWSLAFHGLGTSWSL